MVVVVMTVVELNGDVMLCHVIISVVCGVSGVVWCVVVLWCCGVLWCVVKIILQNTL